MNCSDDLLGLANKNPQANTVAIYGHGLSDPNENDAYGAKGIEGEDSIISFEEISNHVAKYDNLIIISCRGGTPDYDEFENFNGLWSSVFERFKGSIILCKWDVATDETITIVKSLLDECINNGVNIDEALLSIQKSLGEKLNLQFWAGIEFWIN